jgi:hypothetical protein
MVAVVQVVGVVFEAVVLAGLLSVDEVALAIEAGAVDVEALVLKGAVASHELVPLAAGVASVVVARRHYIHLHKIRRSGVARYHTALWSTDEQ